MNTRHDTAIAQQQQHAGAPRFDLYAPIHKAWRLMMTETLQRIGALDLEDEAGFTDALQAADALCERMRLHVAHENDFVHPALEAARPGSSARIADEHREHLDAIDSLEDAVQALRAAAPAQRPALALRLYRQMALFVAENFAHMHVEETAHNAVLWSAYSDAQLAALDGRIVGSLPPEEMMDALGYIARAATPQDLRAMLGAMQPALPPEAFAQVIARVRGWLAPGALQHALHGLAV